MRFDRLSPWLVTFILLAGFAAGSFVTLSCGSGGGSLALAQPGGSLARWHEISKDQNFIVGAGNSTVYMNGVYAPASGTDTILYLVAECRYSAGVLGGSIRVELLEDGGVLVGQQVSTLTGTNIRAILVTPIERASANTNTLDYPSDIYTLRVIVDAPGGGVINIQSAKIRLLTIDGVESLTGGPYLY